MFKRKPPTSTQVPAAVSQTVPFHQVSDVLRGSNRADAEAFIAARTRFAYLGKNVGMAIVLGKYKMFVDTTDRGIAPHMIFEGYWEYWLTKFIADNVKPGDVVCDVGANVGYYSVLMGELVGPDGHVHCFEPNPRMCELVRGTLSQNGFASRSTLHDVALSESEQPDIAFFIPHNEPKNARVVTPGFVNPAGETIMVRSRRMDFIRFQRLDFIKIDVEGAELGVLRGLQSLKDAFNPKIVAEVNFGRGYSYDDIVALLGHGGVLQHVDWTGDARPLTREMAAHERINEDWLVYWPGR